MRPTRVLYVENDPALRGILSHALSLFSGIELLASVGSASEALAQVHTQACDVALLDLALGSGSMNGVELGIALRSVIPDIGIVIYSQHAMSHFTDSIPTEFQWGWSVVQKRSDVDLEALVEVLRSTARGINSIDSQLASTRPDGNGAVIHKLSGRQREIMALVATGVDTNVIAETLGISAVTVREHLSRAYQLLVPNPRPGTDLRTTAVLRYLRETRVYAQTAEE